MMIREYEVVNQVVRESRELDESKELHRLRGRIVAMRVYRGAAEVEKRVFKSVEGLLVEGNTYPIKDHLKSLGFKWVGTGWLLEGEEVRELSMLTSFVETPAEGRVFTSERKDKAMKVLSVIADVVKVVREYQLIPYIERRLGEVIRRLIG